MKMFCLIFLVGMAALSSAAHADGYICDVQGQDTSDIGSEISVGIYNGKLDVTGGDENGVGFFKVGATGELDSSYRPRPNHAGATRYMMDDACDEGETTGTGHLTFDINCDTDCGAPSFEVYSCSVQ
jgi:hypothetical protein